MTLALSERDATESPSCCLCITMRKKNQSCSTMAGRGILEVGSSETRLLLKQRREYDQKRGGRSSISREMG